MKVYFFGLIIAIVVLPIIINMTGKIIVINSDGEYGEWLSFWGSYLGGIISGALTLIGVSIGLKNEQRKNLTMRFLQNAKDINGFEDFLDETLVLVDVSREKRDIPSLDHSLKKCENYIDKFYQIDLDFPKHLEEFKTELFGFKITLEYLDSEDQLIREHSVNYHKNNIDNFKDITRNIKIEYQKLKNNLL
ncbi:hypothetical protein [Lysinibacillus fusiformis]|uniref:hypothetical protein n=1 Tax=Lysinibacillus fusiformis TaxID=28031 RepID=UPI0034E29F81